MAPFAERCDGASGDQGLKVAVFGKTGQVATELGRRIPQGVEIEVLGRDVADFSDPEMVYAAARDLQADAVINAVAYTAVDRAEDEAGLAGTVNETSVGCLARGCAESRIPLVHLSTDYVFSGHGQRPWRPDDPTAPLSVYGKSKLAGEQAIAKHNSHFAILRASWVFSAHGSNFVKTMLRLGAERDRLSIVADQVGGPTPAAAIADACYQVAAQLCQGQTGGIFHYSGAPDVNWADFAREIFATTGMKVAVDGIATADYPTPARRPLNSRLDCSALEQEFGILRPDWKAGLAEVLAEVVA